MHFILLFGLLALILSGCAASASTPVPSSLPSTSPPSTSTPSPTAPATSLPDETPPRGAELEFSTDFGRHSVPYNEIPGDRPRMPSQPLTNPSSSPGLTCGPTGGG